MTQVEILYQALRSDILNMVLAPGLRLSERKIESSYSGASRTPIRTALLMLEADKLVQKKLRTWFVMPLCMSHIQQACEFRVGLERAGLALAHERATSEQIDALEQVFIPEDADLSREDWLKSGREFHVELMRLSGNELFVDAMQDVMQRLARIRWLEVIDEAGRTRTIIEHREILRHLRAGDVDEACKAARRHALETQKRHEDTLIALSRQSGFQMVGSAYQIA